ncbi:acetolactate synthase large subunit [Geomicrobium sp. JCM 19038]|uniref:acetolactate synthase large subunit n=1 Tax=Geomicrobium sp. JCM 19038 TaxID=1460635 RepID=UPI00187CCF6B|nr:acetolactate synthase large subunit [Geomicrobium sp. JCM 19038]
MDLEVEAKMQAAEQTDTQMSGSQMILQSLVEEGVDIIFGYPGGAILPTYDEIYKKGIRHILARHEQGAIHAAEGYARVSGKAGVCIVTSGPGATNVVTGIADAMIDSLPLIVISGQVATNVIGTDAFQEADMVGITMPITKHNFQIRDVQEIPTVMKQAFHIATTGRPGPVLIDLPKDVSTNVGTFNYPKHIELPGYQPTVQPNRLQIKKLNAAIKEAKRPVILAGAGVLLSGGSSELATFAKTRNIPVVTTLLGLGSFPESEELSLGMAGMHGLYTANMALHESDLLINIGARFDDRLTGNLDHFAPNATIAHVDVDPAEIGKNIDTDIPIVSDAKRALEILNTSKEENDGFTAWHEHLTSYQKENPLWYEEDGETLKPQKLLELIYEETNGEAIVTTDVGQHQMWTAQYYQFDEPDHWVTSGGLGTMGFGFPAAIGAQFAKPDKAVVAVIGDAGFQMTLQELSILQELNLPVKIVIVNNASLGMVRQWQQLFYEERYSHSLFPIQPDFIKLAEAYNIPGFKVENPDEARDVLKKGLEMDGPVLFDFRVTSLENVYPMIAPGKGHQEMEGVKP